MAGYYSSGGGQKVHHGMVCMYGHVIVPMAQYERKLLPTLVVRTPDSLDSGAWAGATGVSTKWNDSSDTGFSVDMAVAVVMVVGSQAHMQLQMHSWNFCSLYVCPDAANDALAVYFDVGPRSQSGPLDPDVSCRYPHLPHHRHRDSPLL